MLQHDPRKIINEIRITYTIARWMIIKVRQFQELITVFSLNENTFLCNPALISKGKIRRGFSFMFGGNENKVILLLKSDL